MKKKVLEVRIPRVRVPKEIQDTLNRLHNREELTDDDRKKLFEIVDWVFAYRENKTYELILTILITLVLHKLAF